MHTVAFGQQSHYLILCMHIPCSLDGPFCEQNFASLHTIVLKFLQKILDKFLLGIKQGYAGSAHSNMGKAKHVNNFGKMFGLQI